MATFRDLAGALEPRRCLPHLSMPLSKGLPFLFLLLPGTYQAVSLLNRLLGNCLLQRARRVVISEEILRGRCGSIVRVAVGGRKGREGRESSRGSSITSCLTMTSFTLFFRVMGVGVSAAAAGLGLGGSALGSQQIPREYCLRPCGIFL
jgi:hypothetical protein